MWSVFKCWKQSSISRNRRPLRRKNDRESEKERNWKEKKLAIIKRKEVVVGKKIAATKKHNTRSSSTSSANNPIMPSAIRATLVSSDSAIQPGDPHSAVSSNVSCVISHLASSLPSTYYAAEQDRQSRPSQEEPALDADYCECTFCFEPYCKNGKEWLECACSRWVHELCLEDVIIHNGQERLCPFCIKSFSVP